MLYVTDSLWTLQFTLIYQFTVFMRVGRLGSKATYLRPVAVDNARWVFFYFWQTPAPKIIMIQTHVYRMTNWY